MGSNPTLSAILQFHILIWTLLWRSTQEVEEAPLLRAQVGKPARGFKSLLLRQNSRSNFSSGCYFFRSSGQVRDLNPKRRGPAGVRGSTAASGGNREKPAPQRSERGKAAWSAADRVPGTARGPAKQVQIPPSPPKTPNPFSFGGFLFYSSLFTLSCRLAPAGE